MVNLTDRYRPRTLADFVGLDKPRAILAKLAADPFPSSWLFAGPPGIGKTTAGLALAETLPAELHHIPSRDCDLEAVRETLRQCAYVPARGRFHLVLVDEADEMTRAAQTAFLSALDATAAYQPSFADVDPLAGGQPPVIFVFTANDTAGLEKRFLSRCRVLEFSSYGIAAAGADLLARIWSTEAAGKPAPNFARILKDSTNNLRDALMKLELELMAA